MSEMLEELEDLPKEWIDLLESMPDVMEDFVEDKELDMDEMIPSYFFSYFEDDYRKCEPFFTCFEGGKAVFDNFYGIYGDTGSNDGNKITDDEQILELLKKHIEEMKYMTELNDNQYYDFDSMQLMVVSKEEFIKNEKLRDIKKEEGLRSELSAAMIDYILPEEEDNPICAFYEALYEQTQNNYILYYILWPLSLIKNKSNPFESYKILWENNISVYLVDENLMIAVR
ncbi:MAG: hypothetical protein K2M78_11480 [Lachnospiraceae bacterium]|nr:hypothetical protein [Lachnospiraceae bacterium]